MLIEPTEDDLARLHAITGETPAPVPEAYLTEPRGRHRGQAAALLRPRATEEVSAILSHCAARGIAVIPRSGGTGLVGGQVRGEGPAPVILSLERMDRIRWVAAEDDALCAEAGAILSDVQGAAAEADRLFPLSMASEGSARIGGNLATNAGGVQVLRYGNARDLVLGIEAVLPDGSVHHGLKTLRKDNTGYDLRHLMIGAEGTLGVITAAVLRLFPRPGETVTAMLAVPGPEAALALFHAMRRRVEGLSAFELISGRGVAFVRAGWPDRPDPLADDPPWRVLVEATGPEGAGLAERAEAALAEAVEAGLAGDGVIAQSEAQRAAMWGLREMIPEGNRRVGAIASHDISVPLSAIAGFIAAAERDVAAVDASVRVNCFGHLGDGNLHYNLFPAEGRRAADYRGVAERLTQAVHDRVHALGGSISAEHGIGRAKRDELAARGDPAKLAAMRAIKAALDPGGILNPGAVLAAD
jgi:FAD/FMN-containing dehydrogenase